MKEKSEEEYSKPGKYIKRDPGTTTNKQKPTTHTHTHTKPIMAQDASEERVM
jgi:hypothetical protein